MNGHRVGERSCQQDTRTSEPQPDTDTHPLAHTTHVSWALTSKNATSSLEGAAHASRITVLFKVAKLLTEFRRTCLGTQFGGVVSIMVERAQWNSWQWEQVGGALHILEDQEKGLGGGCQHSGRSLPFPLYFSPPGGQCLLCSGWTFFP